MNSKRVGMFLSSVYVLFVLMSMATVAAPIEVRVAGWGGANGDILKQYIAEFNTIQSDVRIVQEVYQGEEQLLVSYAAGISPDVVIVRGPVPLTYAGNGGMFISLDRYIDGVNGFNRNTLIPDAWNFTTVDGKCYGVAIDSSERALFVNRSLAEQAGLSFRNSVKNWDDLLVWAKKMTIKQGDTSEQWGFWTNFDTTGGTLWHWIWLNDGKLFSKDASQLAVDDPNTVEAIQYLKDMIHEHGVAPAHGGQGKTAFLKNQLAMLITPSDFMTQVDSSTIEYVTIPGPPGTGKQGGRFSGATTSVMMIPDTTKVADAAWEFVRWLTVEKGIDLANQRKMIPLVAQGLRHDRYQSQPWDAFAQSILTYRPENHYNVRLSPLDWWTGTDNLQSVITSILKGQSAVLPALTEISRKVTVTIREAKK